MFYNNLKILLNNSQRLKLYIIMTGSLFSTIFEVVGIGSIPIFIMLITDIDFLISKMPSGCSWFFWIGYNFII